MTPQQKDYMVGMFLRAVLWACLIGVAFIAVGCATVYDECKNLEKGTPDFETCQEIAREYDRITYLETVFYPSLASCMEQGGHSQWNLRGPTSPSLQRALKNGDYSSLSRLDLISWSCCGSNYCEL